MYILHPPFFKEEYGLSFGESWEIFCLKLLKIHYKSNEIEKRNPPESGIDLFYPKEKIAFQCKSIADNNGKFHYTNAKKSLEDALKIQKELGWEKFILCINGEINGNQIKKLKEIYENIEIYSKYFWIHICENHPETIQNNFKKIIDVPSSYQTNKLKHISRIPEEIKSVMKNKGDCFPIWIYLNQKDLLIPVDIYSNMTVGNLQNIIKNLLGITEKTFIHTSEVQVICELYYQGNFIEDNNMLLKKLHIQPYDIVSLNLKIELPDIGISSLMLDEVENIISTYLLERERFLLNSIKSYMERGY